jgi:hypothetical protein
MVLPSSAYTVHISGIYLLLFPELAALSHDVITRPRGKWASQPWRMILTPTLTATLGLFVSRHVSYGAIAIAAVALGSLLIIKLLRSAIAPAISAGVLPIVLDERSWVYPAAIFAGLVGLVALLLSWRRYGLAWIIHRPTRRSTPGWSMPLKPSPMIASG